MSCRYGDGLEAGAKAHEYADRSGVPFLAGYEAQMRVHIAIGPTPVPQALARLDEISAAEGGRDLWAEGFRAGLLASIGRVAEARAVHAKVTAAFRDRGMPLAAAIYGQEGWDVETYAGDVAAATAIARESCAALEAMGERGWMSTNAAQLADSLFVAGDYEQSEQWTRRALELTDTSDAVTQAMARSVLARLAARSGDADNARAEIRDVLEITAGMQAPLTQGKAAMDVAEVYAALGDSVAAAEQLHRAIEFYTAKGATVPAARARETLAALAAAP